MFRDVPVSDIPAMGTPERQRWGVDHFVREAAKAYAAEIHRDHPVIAAHHALDRLARRQDVGVMYYTVQTPDKRARQDWNFMALKFALQEDAGVRVVTMLDTVAPEEFEVLEHLHNSGMRKVAARLIDEIVKSRDASRDTPPVSAPGR